MAHLNDEQRTVVRDVLEGQAACVLEMAEEKAEALTTGARTSTMAAAMALAAWQQPLGPPYCVLGPPGWAHELYTQHIFARLTRRCN